MIENLVSIITPVYNSERFISDTIKSVLNQTYTDFEMLLIDDHSSDNSLSILSEFAGKDERVKVYQTPLNSGSAVARNLGLEKANGQYVAFIDSDDMWKESKLADQLKMMKQNNYGFTYTNFEIIAENKEIIKPVISLPQTLNYQKLLKNTAIACSTVMIDKKVFGEFRMPDVRKGQDTATWLRLLRSGKTAHLVDEVLGSYRIVKGSISSNKISALKRTWNTYRNLEKLPLYKAVYYFTHYVWNALKRRT